MTLVVGMGVSACITAQRKMYLSNDKVKSIRGEIALVALLHVLDTYTTSKMIAAELRTPPTQRFEFSCTIAVTCTLESC